MVINFFRLDFLQLKSKIGIFRKGVLEFCVVKMERVLINVIYKKTLAIFGKRLRVAVYSYW